MGCCSSTNTDGHKLNNTYINGYYDGAAEQQQRHGSKRSLTSRISNGSSSGVSTACTSPSRRSILTRFNTNSPTSPTAKTNTRKFKLNCNDVPTKDIEMLTICDDFCEGGNVQHTNKSYGYFSESMSTASGSSTTLPTHVRTQDTSGLGLESPEPQIILPSTPRDLEMEWYMMDNSPCLMPKTSSPIFQRRDVTYNAVGTASPSSCSYQKWTNYLQTTPAYMLINVKRIPEAITGNFSPSDFPAYTDLEEMESAAKRYKVDIQMMQPKQENELVHQQQLLLPANITHTISTEL